MKESTTEAPDLNTDSQESTSSQPPQTPTTSSRNKEYNRNVYIMLDVNHKIVEPKDVIEYEWPPKSGDRWFLQEQIGELLNIKSFSRKYPDFTRRKVNHEEREFLEWNFGLLKLLNETQLRDMNAMRASEIHDMMNGDFPDIYMEYKKVVALREREIQLEKAKEMEAIKNDSVKLAELRRKAVQSAVNFNKELQNQRRNERKHFWDIQTNIIQSPRNKWLVMKPEATRPGPYPVALIPGQYSTYYKKFTPEELNRLPLGTVMDTSNLFPPAREPSPPPLTIATQDLARLEREEAMRAREPPMNHGIQMKQEPVYTPAPIDPNRACDSCEKIGGEMICCATCEIAYHPQCIEMPDRMAALVKTYEWSCVDCRVCSVCSKPEKDDEIVFCDRCDRGFHSFCVGLRQLPRGSWICSTFCSPEQIRNEARRSSMATVGGRR
uniref:PHD finger protein 10 n=1 Tax=Caenorhabditis tropicalis TaxID=1561998 RepID=A0A1I7T9Z4_9PELO